MFYAEMSQQRSTSVIFLITICALLIEHGHPKLVGAPEKHELSEKTKQELMGHALNKFHETSNSLYTFKVVNLVDWTSQVVAGLKYVLTLELGETTCLKDQSNAAEGCKLKYGPENNLMYKASVYVRPWDDFTDTRILEVTNKDGKKYEPDIDAQLSGQHLGMFLSFVNKHNKVYSDSHEFNKRFRIFRANLKKISTLQSTEQGTGEYGVTEFSDLSAREFKQKYLGLDVTTRSQEASERQQAVIPNVVLPTNFDWRDYNAVTPVKNQGQCGSCWAFSVTGNVEGQYAIKHKKLISLSEQELVDCDSLDSGCQGGFMDNAYKAIEQLGGLETETDYPYDGDKEACVFNKTEVKVTISGALNISSNETKMAQWLFKNGPISIGINANAMQFYMGGVSHPLKFLCNPKGLDHGVLVVGFGVHRTSIRHKILPYWLVKNSWGPRWGEKGYYRVYRGDGTCGVNQMASSAIVD